MTMEEKAKKTSDTERKSKSLPVDRRSYLKLAAAGTAAATGSATLMTGTAAGATTRHGIQFTNIVNMVTDVGCDPTGQQACDAKVRNAADDYTLLKFPAGTYKFTEKNAILDKVNLGLLGIGDVRFKVPEIFNEKVFVIDRGDGLLFENIDIDLTAYGATPGLHLAADDNLQIHDVEFIGQGINPVEVPQECGNTAIDSCNLNPEITDAFFPIVRSPDGTGLVRNIVAKNAGIMGAYSRIGTWIGIDSEGTIKLENCRFEGFSGNGLYCSRTNGVVQVEGGTFRNNDISQVRLGSEGSYVDGANIVVDFNNSDSPNPEDTLNARGIRFEGTKIASSGPKARNCEINIVSAPNTEGGIVATRTCGDFGVFDTRIQVDIDGVPAITAKEPVGEFGYPAPPEPHFATIRNVNVTGNAAGREAIYINQRRSSLIEDSCIEQNSSNRDGVMIRNLENGTVRRSTIDVTGEPIITESSSVETGSIVTDESSCPRPTGSKVLTIEGTGSRATYSFAVSGTLQKSGARGATIDDNDVLSGRRATGQVGQGGRDSYVFTGEITTFTLDGDATILLNDQLIDPGEFLPRTLIIDGDGSRTDYTFTVSGNLEGKGLTREDRISGSTATGAVGGGRDKYRFSGEVTDFSISGDATVYLDGEEIDPTQLLTHTLTIDGDGSRTDYTFTVSGNLEGKGLTREDRISGSTAIGAVGGGQDSYRFSGDIIDFSITGDATVFLDDMEISTLTITSDSGRYSYEFSVSGNLAKSTAMDASIDDNDIISGNTATGQGGGGGRDSYIFTGNISNFEATGDIIVYLNGRRVSPSQF